MKYIKNYVDNLKEDRELLISNLKEFDINASDESLEELIESVGNIQSILNYQSTRPRFYPKINFPKDMANYDTSFLNYKIGSGENYFVGEAPPALNPLEVLDLTRIQLEGTSFSSTMRYIPAKVLDISTWDTSKVTSISKLFNENSSSILEEIRLPYSFVTSKCTLAQEVFNNCYKLKRLDLRGWDVSNCTSLYRMAYHCEGLQYLNISGWDTSKLKNFEGFLQYVGSSNSTPTEIIGLEDLDTSNVTSIKNTFLNTNIEHLDLSHWDVSKVKDASNIFQGTNTANKFIKSINISGWNLKSVTDVTGMFTGLTQVESIDFSNVRIPDFKGTSLQYFISGCTSLKTLDLQCFNPEEFSGSCKNISYLINGCTSLETADLSYLNCRPTNISNFAYNCKNLSYLDIRNIDLQDVTNVASAFYNVPNTCTIIVRDDVAKTKVLQSNPNLQNIVIAELSEIKILNTYTTIGLDINYITLKLFVDTHVEEQKGVRFEITGPATIDENNILTLTEEAESGDSITVTAISTYNETIRDNKVFEVLESIKDLEFTGKISTETESEHWFKRKTTFKGLSTYGIESVGMNEGGELIVTTRGYNKIRIYIEYKGNTVSRYLEIKNVIDNSSMLKINSSTSKVESSRYTYDINPEESQLSFVVTKNSGVIMGDTYYNKCNIIVEVYNE